MKGTATKALLAMAVFLLLAASVGGQEFYPAIYVDVTEVEGLTLDGYIPSGGADLTIPIRFINVDVPRTAISNGYHFVGEHVIWSAFDAQWNPAYPWDWPHAIELGIFPPFFDQGLFLNYFENGVGFAGLTGANGSGLPADFDGIAYFLTLHDAMLDPYSGWTGGHVTLDTTWWPPANYWLWSGVAEDVWWGGPYTFDTEPHPCPPPYTTCWPQPTVLKALENDRILNVSIHWEVIEDVVFESILVQGKIPPYTAAAPYVDGDSIVTDCFIMRFLGASGFRPIPPEGVQSTYTVEYDKVSGEHVVLTGDFVLSVYQGDVTLDGLVNAEDVVFMSQYLWHKGPMCEIEEFMDVDANGRVDIRDMSALIEIVGI